MHIYICIYIYIVLYITIIIIVIVIVIFYIFGIFGHLVLNRAVGLETTHGFEGRSYEFENGIYLLNDHVMPWKMMRIHGMEWGVPRCFQTNPCIHCFSNVRGMNEMMSIVTLANTRWFRFSKWLSSPQFQQYRSVGFVHLYMDSPHTGVHMTCP